MEDSIILKHITNLDKREFADAMEDKTAQEIDAITQRIIAYANGERLEYQALKGRVCSALVTHTKLDACMREIKRITSDSIALHKTLPPAKLGGAVEIGSEAEYEAIQTAIEEMQKLEGMHRTLGDYAERVLSHCEIYLKAVFGEKNNAMDMPDILLGQRLPDGSWDIESCRDSFYDIMLFEMDHFDWLSIPYRATGSTT